MSVFSKAHEYLPRIEICSLESVYLTQRTKGTAIDFPANSYDSVITC